MSDPFGAALAPLRTFAARMMVDTCTITRPDPDAPAPVMNEDMTYPPRARITVYTGPCRIQVKSVIASSNAKEAGDRAVTTQEFEWQGPVDGTEDVTVNDVIHMDTAANDASLVDREFTVKARHEKTHATTRRLRVVEGTA